MIDSLAANVVQPNYGFTVENSSGSVKIAVEARKAPLKLSANILRWCIIFLPLWCFILPGMTFVGGVAGDIFRSPTASNYATAWAGSAVVFIPGVIALLWFMGRVARQREQFKDRYREISLVVDSNHITIDGVTYKRAHVNSWAIRWVPLTGGESLMVGADSSQQGEHCYCITFDYAAKRVNAIEGLTESMADRVMNALTGALAGFEPTL